MATMNHKGDVFMNLSISYYSSKGKRKNNEDSVSLIENNNGVLAIVADGLGGHADGEVASALAVSTIHKQLQSQQPNEDRLVEAIQQANRDIYTLGDERSAMHTTVAVLWLGDYLTVAANVGDSRIYQFRNNQIIYQSMDHSVAQMAVLVGELKPSEIRGSKDRNKLIRVLGDPKELKVDCESLYVQKGDRFLLCSDGFWEAVTEADMLETMAESQNAELWLQAMQSIVQRIAKPNQDNHTAIAMVINE